MSEEENKIDGGGQAFPRADGQGRHVPGMSLRDFFAAHALVGQLAESAHPQSPGLGNFNLLAQRSYEIADAMLAARTTQTQNKG